MSAWRLMVVQHRRPWWGFGFVEVEETSEWHSRPGITRQEAETMRATLADLGVSARLEEMEES